MTDQRPAFDRILSAELQRLEPLQLCVIELMYLRGQTQHQIADLLALKHTQVAHAAALAMQTLGRALEARSMLDAPPASTQR